jgi:hypothetical protein
MSDDQTTDASKTDAERKTEAEAAAEAAKNAEWRIAELLAAP